MTHDRPGASRPRPARGHRAGSLSRCETRLDLRRRPHRGGGRARPGPAAARHAGRSRRRHPGGAPAVPGRPRPLRGRGAARRDRAARAPRVRCAGVLPLQHRRDRAGGADKGSQCRRPGRRRRGVHELGAAGQPAPAPRGRARSLPARALPRGSDPGLGGRRRRPRRFLAAGAPAGRDRGAGAAAARARRRARAARSRPLPGRRAGSPRCSLPFPPPSNGADPCATCFRSP